MTLILYSTCHNKAADPCILKIETDYNGIDVNNFSSKIAGGWLYKTTKIFNLLALLI